ncbi:MAG TPA: carboxyltransferase domain-containing protein [Arthrobacter sp.]|jgi:allophanate hydrolase subunit 1|uniref:carboxyltransferase domain-containing protein n=1 Tax=Arthrobacter sp. TaxID=1667 RepID=UPI002F416E7F
MRFSPTFAVINSGQNQASAIISGTDALAVRRKIMSLEKAVQSYGLPGIEELTTAGRSLVLEYDPSLWTHASIKAALIALESTIAQPVESPPAQLFEWPLLLESEETDLELAAAASELTPEAFIARLTRRTHIIQDFTLPGLSPQLFRRDFRGLSAGYRPREIPRQIPSGSLTLCSEGFAVTAAETATHDLVIGRVPAACLDPETASFRIGDRIRFQTDQR